MIKGKTKDKATAYQSKNVHKFETPKMLMDY